MYNRLKTLAIATMLMITGSACASGPDLETRDYYRKQKLQTDKQKAVALSRVAIGYANIGETAQATHLLNQALATSNSIENPYYESFALPDIAVGYAENGQYNQALESVTLIQEKGVGRNTSYQIMLIASAAGDYEQALQMSQTFLKDEIDQMIGAGGRFQYSETDPLPAESASATRSEHSKANTLIVIANQAIQTEPENEALLILDQTIQQSNAIPDITQRSKAIAEIAVNYAKVGQSAEAIELLNQAQQILPTDDIETSDIETLSEIAVNYAEIGQQIEALQLLKQVRQAISRSALVPGLGEVSLLGEVAVDHAEVGQPAEALALLDRALQSAKTIEDVLLKFDVLNEVAAYYAEIGYLEQASQVVTLIDQWYLRTPGGGSAFTDALAEVAIRYAEIGQPDRALQLVENVNNRRHRTTVLTQIAIAYAQAGQYEQAFQIIQLFRGEFFRGIGNSSAQAYVLFEITAQAVQVEPPAIALPVLDQALSLANSIQDEEHRVGAFAAIASRYHEAGQPAQALKYLEQARSMAEAIGS